MADETFVLDSSAAVKLFLLETESDAFRSWHRGVVISGGRLAAPTLIGYEISQVVARNMPASTPDEFATVVRLALEGIATEPTYEKVGPFVGRISAYDASYLATAAELQATLVTYDHALAREAARHGIKVLSPK